MARHTAAQHLLTQHLTSSFGQAAIATFRLVSSLKPVTLPPSMYVAYPFSSPPCAVLHAASLDAQVCKSCQVRGAVDIGLKDADHVMQFF